MSSRSAYRGPKRKLVLAFDVGTTYSGISYRHVESIKTSHRRLFDKVDKTVFWILDKFLRLNQLRGLYSPGCSSD